MNLNDDYRNFADGREDLVTAVYYEKHLTNKTAVVVTRDDADPGVSGATPVAVDKDHINICKPRDQDDIIYRAVRRHVQKTLRSVEKHSSDSQDFLWETDDYAERHVEGTDETFSKN